MGGGTAGASVTHQLGRHLRRHLGFYQELETGKTREKWKFCCFT